jgi:hypothetical protein
VVPDASFRVLPYLAVEEPFFREGFDFRDAEGGILMGRKEMVIGGLASNVSLSSL